MSNTNTHEVYRLLFDLLSKSGYTFICPSPETQMRVIHRRMLNESTKDATTLTDFFGWNLPCTMDVLQSLTSSTAIGSLVSAGIIVTSDANRHLSTIRVSNFYLPSRSPTDASQDALYYIHSSFPASSESVFFGPDTYLFVSFIQANQHLLPQNPSSIIDVCCGSGAGAIHLARTYPEAYVLGLDLNPHALWMGAVNANLAGCSVLYHRSDLYNSISPEVKEAGINVIVSNPPYIASSTGGEHLPIYADGGANFGLDLSIRIVREGVELLASDGTIVLYTGVAIPIFSPGHDPLLHALSNMKVVEVVKYTVLHPDMWPEEIGRGAYAEVGRIQVVGAVLRRQTTH